MINTISNLLPEGISVKRDGDGGVRMCDLAVEDKWARYHDAEIVVKRLAELCSGPDGCTRADLYSHFCSDLYVRPWAMESFQ